MIAEKQVPKWLSPVEYLLGKEEVASSNLALGLISKQTFFVWTISFQPSVMRNVPQKRMVGHDGLPIDYEKEED